MSVVVARARAVETGERFWYAKRRDLIEVAANQADADGLTGLVVGEALRRLAWRIPAARATLSCCAARLVTCRRRPGRGRIH